MKNTLLLTKTLFLNNFGANIGTNKKKNKTSSKGLIILFAVLILIVAVPMIFMGSMLGSATLISEARYESLGILFKTIIPFSSIFVIFFSIFSIISTFYLSSDTEILLGLPFKPSEIIIAKFLNSLMTTYLIELMLLTPILIGIGIGGFLHPLYFINVILVTIFLPFIPLSILGIIITSLMRYSALSKMKDKIQYFIMAFSIIFAIGIQFVSQSGASNLEGSEEEILIAISQFPTTLSNIMFFTYPASLSLASENIIIGLLLMLGYCVLSIGAMVLFAYVGGKIYIKGILGKPQIKSKKEKETKVEFEEHSSVFKNIVKNEWKMMWRSPVYNMNLISTVLVVPIILIISFGFSFASGEEGMSFDALLTMVKETLDLSNGSSILFAIAIFSFFTSFSPIASCAISRDGKQAWTNKVMPIKPMTIINAKIFWGIILGIMPVLLISIIGTVLGILSILEFLMINIPLFLLVVLVNYLGIMIDLAKPKLEWDNEQTAVKQNINTFYFMLVDWAFTVIFVLLGIVFLFINIPSFVVSLIIVLLLGLTCVIIYKSLDKKGINVFKNIG